MFKPKLKREGAIDGDEGRGVPLRDDDDRTSEDADEVELTDRDFAFHEEGDPLDRRKDPLRK